MTTTTSNTPLELRIGTVTHAESLEEAEGNLIRLEVDFGDAVGARTSVVDLATPYYPEVLFGRQIVAVLHADGSMTVLGASSEILGLTLVSPDRLLPPGTSLL